MRTFTFSPDATPGDAWAAAGLTGLAAALAEVGHPAGAPVPLDTLLAAAEWATAFPDRFPDGEVGDCLHEGWARSLLGHAKTRERDAAGRLARTAHRRFRSDWLAPNGRPRAGVKLTRAILPNWIDSGGRWPLAGVAPLWFAPLAACALPLPGGGAVLLAPLALGTPRAVDLCRAVLPTDPTDCYPASAADAAVSLFLRLGEAGAPAGQVCAWEFGWVAGNRSFREVRGIVRADRPGPAALARWAAFAAATPPAERTHAKTGAPFRSPHRLRGLAADNLVAGRRPWEGYQRLALEGDKFGCDGPAARAMFRHLLAAGD